MLHWEVEELLGYAVGKSEAEVEEMINNSTVDDVVYEKYDIDFDTYYKIVGDLFKHIPVIKTELTGDRYHAFVTEDQKRMIARKKYNSGENG